MITNYASELFEISPMEINDLLQICGESPHGLTSSFLPAFARLRISLQTSRPRIEPELQG